MSSSYTTLTTRPLGMLDAQHQLNQVSYLYTAMRGDSNGGATLVYVGFARPGADEGDLVWQLRFLQYDGNGNIISMTYPQNTAGHATGEFQFSWTDRASYTYS